MNPILDHKRIMGLAVIALSVCLQALAHYSFLSFPQIAGIPAADALFHAGITLLGVGVGHAIMKPVLPKNLGGKQT